MKLNNKGMTIIEILVTFVIVVVVVTSLYASVIALKNKETIASYKESLTTYRDLMIRDIESDLIEKGLSSYSISTPYTKTDKITFIFKDGQKKDLIITHNMGCHAISQSEQSDTTLCPWGNPAIGDNYSITYGGVNYKLPNIGSTTNIANQPIYDLIIDNVVIDNSSSDIFDLKIILYHPDLGTKYSIHITSPIDA